MQFHEIDLFDFTNFFVLKTREFNFTDFLFFFQGTKSNTFGVPGIASEEEAFEHNTTGTNLHHVFFLKQLEHARYNVYPISRENNKKKIPISRKNS